MLDLDEFTITDAALEQMANTANPRLKQIMDAAVRHLHAFAREVELTPAEWISGLALPDSRGPGMHADPTGIHSSVRRTWRQRRGQRATRPQGEGTRIAEQSSGAVLS